MELNSDNNRKNLCKLSPLKEVLLSHVMKYIVTLMSSFKTIKYNPIFISLYKILNADKDYFCAQIKLIIIMSIPTISR